MSEQTTDPQVLHQRCVERFIDVANAMQRENISPEVISSALMAASGIYTTFTIAGNEGGLHATGVEKVVARYRDHLERVQAHKRAEYGETSN
jgi:hypothetical protein